jgi:hypothetical protein
MDYWIISSWYRFGCKCWDWKLIYCITWRQACGSASATGADSCKSTSALSSWVSACAVLQLDVSWYLLCLYTLILTLGVWVNEIDHFVSLVTECPIENLVVSYLQAHWSFFMLSCIAASWPWDCAKYQRRRHRGCHGWHATHNVKNRRKSHPQHWKLVTYNVKESVTHWHPQQ